MLLKVALNGSRSTADHPAVPLHPPELAAAAKAAIAAGAGAVHLHPRNRAGGESLAPDDVARAVAAVREASDAPVGVTTGAWIEPDAGRRLELVSGWRRAAPDFASVNFHEPGAVVVADALLAIGVGVEAGLATADAAERLVESELEVRCLRVLLEPQEDDPRAALETVAAIEQVLRRSLGSAPRLLHGADATAWPLLAEAVRRGYDIRIGLEDTLRHPDGRPAVDNADLVSAALRA